MAAIANTATTLTTKGIREDLEDTIYRVAASKTPFQNNIGSSGKATATYHEWQTETLAAPSASNFQLEGNDYGSTFGAENITTRVGNYCQIFVKTGIVSGTDDEVKKAGRKSELNRQKVLKGIELKTDMEMTFMGNVVSGQESGATPRKCAGLPAWLTTNTSFGAGGSAGGFSAGVVSAATPGTNRTFTEALVKAIRTTAFSNGAGQNMQVYMSGTNKQQFGAFTGIASIRVEASKSEQATIIGAADVYQDDYGRLSLIPHQYAIANMALFVDPEMVGVATLRGMRTEALAKTGDAEKFSILAEKTLVCKNQKAHAVIFALT
jgi:hypothetical protein